MQIQRSFLLFIRLTADIISIIFAFLLADYFNSPVAGITFSYNEFLVLVSFLIIWFFTSKSFNLYDGFRSKDFSHEVVAIIQNIFVQAVSGIVLIFFIKSTGYSRLFIINYVLILLILLIIQKYMIRLYLYNLRRKGRNMRSVLIIGAGEVGFDFYNEITMHLHFGYKVIGFLDDRKIDRLKSFYLGPIKKLKSILESQRVDEVIVALPNYATERLEEVVNICDNYTTHIQIIPDYFRFISSKYAISMFGRFPIISVRVEKINQFHWRLLKRAIDTTFSLFLFTFVFSWLWPLIGLAIKLDSKGPVFFKQERWGRNNEKILAYKFRSMIACSNDVDENGKYQQACKDDPRITKVGAFLRKTNLDELPQFINILKGEMSLVGPRPHPGPLNVESKDKINHYMLRHLVKPGLTGWAQVNGFRGETKESSLMQKRIDYDIWYMENWSFWLDIQIIILTAWKMLKGDPHAY